MSVRQISVSLQNVPGKLSGISDYLAENGVNMIALSLTDEGHIGTIRFVVNDPERAANVLRTHGYAIEITDVLAVEAPNHPGGLAAILKPLKEASVNVNYLYACLGAREKTVLIMGVDRMADAIQVLKENWVHIFNEELYAS